jgi:hypothetical protein
VVSLDLNISVGDSAFHAQGEADVVMKALAEFKALVEAAPKTKRQVASSEEKQDGKDDGGASGTDQPLSVFVKRSWPGQAEKATAIVMWAKHHENKDALKPSEIEDYWRKTPGKVPANMTAACKAAEKQGWLHNEGGGRYSITGHGEEMVNGTTKS